MSVEREQKGKKNEEVCFEQFILLLIGFINKPRRKIAMSITYTNKNKNKSGIQDNISSHEKVALLWSRKKIYEILTLLDIVKI